MWIRIVNFFVKVTGYIPQLFFFSKRIYYENRKVQGRHIKGPALLVSNHIKVFDYVLYMFVFLTRTIRTTAAEVLYRRPLLGPLLNGLGCIYVNRESHDTGCITKSENLLKHGWVVLTFPEARLPKPNEETPLPYKTGAAVTALETGAPVIPLITNGSYFNLKRPGRCYIGTPIQLRDWVDESLDERQNAAQVTAKLRSYLGEMEQRFKKILIEEQAEKNRKKGGSGRPEDVELDVHGWPL